MKRLKIILITAMLFFILFGLYLAKNGKKEYSQSEFVLDTACSVTFYGKDAKEAAGRVFDEVRRIEGLMSMYKKDSDISRINRAKAGDKVKVSGDTYKVIKAALEICQRSGGAFDITVAPVTRLWNFTGENPKIPSKEEISKALISVGYENIVLDENNTVIKKNSSLEIDLGGVAKGYAGDRAKEIAKKYNLTGGIIDLGGNIVCFGTNPHSENGRWTVGIQLPFSPSGTYRKTVEVKEGSVVTSGNYQRYFEENGRLYHHIINPYDGYPSEQNYDSVTIVTDSAMTGDCLATAAYVLGEEKGSELAKEYNGKIYYEKN